MFRNTMLLVVCASLFVSLQTFAVENSIRSKSEIATWAGVLVAVNENGPYSIVYFRRAASGSEVPGSLGQLSGGIWKSLGVYHANEAVSEAMLEEYKRRFNEGELEPILDDFDANDKDFISYAYETLHPNLVGSRTGEPSVKYNCIAAALDQSDLWISNNRVFEKLESTGAISRIIYTQAQFVMHGIKCVGTANCTLGPKVEPVHASHEIVLRSEPSTGCNGEPTTVTIVDKLAGKYGLNGVYRTDPEIPGTIYSCDTTIYYKRN